MILANGSSYDFKERVMLRRLSLEMRVEVGKRLPLQPLPWRPLILARQCRASGRRTGLAASYLNRPAVRPRRSADYMRLAGGRHPSKQLPVIHRELRTIRRISREHPPDRAQYPPSKG
jgi:hypothetical protein